MTGIFYILILIHLYYCDPINFYSYIVMVKNSKIFKVGIKKNTVYNTPKPLRKIECLVTVVKGYKNLINRTKEPIYCIIFLLFYIPSFHIVCLNVVKVNNTRLKSWQCDVDW